MTRGVNPPYPPPGTLGTDSRFARNGHRSSWRPRVAPRTLQGPPWTSPGPPRRDPDSPKAPQKTETKHTMVRRLLFFIFFVTFGLVQLAHLLKKAIKTNDFLTILKMQFWSPIITFTPFSSQKYPSRTPFGQHRAPFWALGPPLEILKRPDPRK